MEHGNNPEQDNYLPLPLGKTLRETRERLGLSVVDVAAQIKFAPRQIEALEADDFQHLPEAAFLRGFVRSYAKILNLDMQVLLAALPPVKTAAAEMIPPSVEVPFPVAPSPQRQNMLLLGAALLLAVIMAGFVLWHFTHPVRPAAEVSETGQPTETPVILPAEIQAASASSSLPPPDTLVVTAPPHAADLPPARPAKVAPAAAAPKKEPPQKQPLVSATQGATALRLVFDEESWTEITGKDGKIISSMVHPPGSELKLQRQLPLSLVIGHAKTTHLYEDGELVDLTPYTNSSSEVARLTLE